MDMSFVHANPLLKDNQTGGLHAAEIGKVSSWFQIPQWLKERVQQKRAMLLVRQKGRGWQEAWVSKEIGRLLDHWGTVEEFWGNTGELRPLFFGDPYRVNSDQLGFVQEFCRKLNLDFSIGADSAHYPTRTIRILIWPKEWNEEFLKPTGMTAEICAGAEHLGKKV